MSPPRDGESGYPPLPRRFTPNGYGLAWFVLGFLGLPLWPGAASSADEPRSLRGHTKQVSGLAFSPDGSKLLSGGNDGKLLLWDFFSLTTSALVGPFFTTSADTPGGGAAS